MGTRGRNGIIVAAIAAACALVTMGVVDLSAERRAETAAPERGWSPADGAPLHAPARQAVAPGAAGGGSGRERGD